MQQIPINQVPNQTLSCVLSEQSVTLAIRQTDYGVFMDVYKSGTLVIGGVICEVMNRIVRSTYLHFDGDFFWQDTQGSDDPDYSGFNDRWLLFYVTPDELAQISAI